MPASCRDLAIALECRLNDVIPAPFRLAAENGLIHMYIDEEPDGAISIVAIVEDETRELSERLESAVHTVLSMVQDDISEHLRTPWPSTDGRTMAMPGVRIDAEVVHLWYGGERAPVLRMPAIRIADIVGTDGATSSST